MSVTSGTITISTNNGLANGSRIFITNTPSNPTIDGFQTVQNYAGTTFDVGIVTDPVAVEGQWTFVEPIISITPGTVISGSPGLIESTAHGLVTGVIVVIDGVDPALPSSINGRHAVIVLDNDHFVLEDVQDISAGTGALTLGEWYRDLPLDGVRIITRVNGDPNTNFETDSRVIDERTEDGEYIKLNIPTYPDLFRIQNIFTENQGVLETALPHGLTTGDYIFIRGLDVTPPLDGVVQIKVISPTEITPLDPGIVFTSVNTNPSGEFVKLTGPTECDVTQIFRENLGRITSNNHLLSTGDGIYIAQSSSQAKIIIETINTVTDELLIPDHRLVEARQVTVSGATTIPDINGIHQVVYSNRDLIKISDIEFPPGTFIPIDITSVTIPGFISTTHLIVNIIVNRIVVQTNNLLSIGDRIFLTNTDPALGINGLQTVGPAPPVIIPGGVSIDIGQLFAPNIIITGNWTSVFDVTSIVLGQPGPANYLINAPDHLLSTGNFIVIFNGNANIQTFPLSSIDGIHPILVIDDDNFILTDVKTITLAIPPFFDWYLETFVSGRRTVAPLEGDSTDNIEVTNACIIGVDQSNKSGTYVPINSILNDLYEIENIFQANNGILESIGHGLVTNDFIFVRNLDVQTNTFTPPPTLETIFRVTKIDDNFISPTSLATVG